MKLEDIFDLWEKDAQIDRTDLGGEALKIAKLHHKYFKIYVAEKILLRSQEQEMKQLKLDKYEFYSDGPNEDTIKKGWRIPAKGRLLKTDIPIYMEGDSDIINLSLKIGVQQEKTNFLESIIKTIANRSYSINSAVDMIKFMDGGK